MARHLLRISDAEVTRLRMMPVADTIRLLGLYAKADRDYTPKDSRSKRIHVSVANTVIELIVTCNKWFDSHAKRGGGGAIDLTMHLYGEPFAKAVRRLQKLHTPGNQTSDHNSNNSLSP